MDLNAPKKLYQREDGSHYLFSEDVFRNHLMRAYGVIAAYNQLSKALVKFEDLADKAKKKDYFLGIIAEGGEHIRNEYRKALEKELNKISFFRAKRASLIQESIDAIPEEIFEEIEKYKGEARREARDLKRPVRPEDLTVKLAEDKSFLIVGLRKEYEEALKEDLFIEVSEEKIKSCEKFLKAIEILRELADEGAVLYGTYTPSGMYMPSIIDSMIARNAKGEYSSPLDVESVVSRLNIIPKK